MAFVALEGVEGSGKTTQAALLADRLRASGCDVVMTREPGGTEIGQAIRLLLLDPALVGFDARAEALLYAADRAEHVATVIRPALDRGAWVVSDRFSDSYRAYQGAGRGLDIEELGRISSWASQGIEPDLVAIIDVPPEQGLERIARAHDRMEAAGAEFHGRVRQAFLELAEAEPNRFAVIDGAESIDAVAEAVWEAVSPMFDESR